MNSYVLSPTLAGNCKTIYNWLNGEYVIIEDLKHPLYNIMKNKKKIFPISLFNGYEEDLEWLLEKHFVFKKIEDYYNLIKQYNKNLNDKNRLHLVILPAGTKCNFRCVYCYENHNDRLMGNIEKDEIIKFVKSQNIKYLTVDFFGGEPLLNVNWIYDFSKEIIDFCNKNNVIYRATITTNGYLLDKLTFKNLLKYKIETFQVTLDGLEHTHNKLRPLVNGKGTFEKILLNLIDIAKLELDFALILRVNFNEEFNIDDFITLISNTKIKDNKNFWFLFRPITSGWNNSKNDVFCKVNSNEKKELFYSVLKSKNLNNGEYILYSKYGNLSCPTARTNYLIITPQLEVKKCTVALDENYNVVGEISNGELIKNNNWDMWISKKDFNKNECLSCEIYPLCLSSSCPLDKIKSSEIRCISEKDKSSQLAVEIVEFLENN